MHVLLCISSQVSLDVNQGKFVPHPFVGPSTIYCNYCLGIPNFRHSAATAMPAALLLAKSKEDSRIVCFTPAKVGCEIGCAILKDHYGPQHKVTHSPLDGLAGGINTVRVP